MKSVLCILKHCMMLLSQLLLVSPLTGGFYPVLTDYLSEESSSETMELALPSSLDFNFLTVHLACWNVRDIFQNTTSKFLSNIQFIHLTVSLYCSSKLPQLLRLNILKIFFSPVWLSNFSEDTHGAVMEINPLEHPQGQVQKHFDL